jgi:pimeloyl-ACP methyl ester carboxylesterase
MTIIKNIPIHYDEVGTGDPLVLVHGSWSDRNNWQLVAPGLAESFQVLAYDRRGHGLSPRDVGSRRDQEDDLAALIEVLDRGPVHVAATSFGASIALGLASRRPDLVRGVIAHEPPLLSVVAEDPSLQPLLAAVGETVTAVCAQAAAGDVAGAAERFVEEVALGPGVWAVLPDSIRLTMIDSAAAFVAEQQDPLWASIELDALACIDCPVLLTKGDRSPPWFPAIVAGLADVIPGAQVLTYPGAGHAPHISHPGDYVIAVTERMLQGATR